MLKQTKIVTTCLKALISRADFIPDKYLQAGCFLENYWRTEKYEIDSPRMLSSHPGIDGTEFELVFKGKNPIMGDILVIPEIDNRNFDIYVRDVEEVTSIIW